MPYAVALLAVLVAAATGGEGGKSETIDGVRVTMGKRYRIVPPATLTEIALDAGTIQQTGEPCIVISGKATSNLPSDDYTLTITIIAFPMATGDNTAAETYTIKVHKPIPGRPTKFQAIGRPGALEGKLSVSALVTASRVSASASEP
ncbi:MAG TPA: hypothetical protein PLE19_10240 [Planctomycetota bacterium]|nr:hypothetical protein [Planctomycetota bacterium]HRR80990.1 hypothetical protein [Planctomycetota bacterium]HRT93652.1 hypothetical protein [Planctomycetota bacterium]